jgi:uncharacterized membrane protein
MLPEKRKVVLLFEKSSTAAVGVAFVRDDQNRTMYSKIKIAGHPLHPMLVAFPIAFYTATVAGYITYACNEEVFWYRLAYVANAAGVAMAIVAALPGFIDWLNIPADSRAKKTGLFHMTANVIALLLYGINFWLQCDKWNDNDPSLGPAIVLTGLGFFITIAAGFLGWTLVQKHHVGVDIRKEDYK